MILSSSSLLLFINISISDHFLFSINLMILSILEYKLQEDIIFLHYNINLMKLVHIVLILFVIYLLIQDKKEGMDNLVYPPYKSYNTTDCKKCKCPEKYTKKCHRTEHAPRSFYNCECIGKPNLIPSADFRCPKDGVDMHYHHLLDGRQDGSLLNVHPYYISKPPSYRLGGD